jgi:hypothetical protein
MARYTVRVLDVAGEWRTVGQYQTRAAVMILCESIRRAYPLAEMDVVEAPHAPLHIHR